MNAVMRELESETVMAEGDQANLAIQVAELRSDVRHVQSDVTDIKADLRITNQRIESLRKETGERFDKHERETTLRFQEVASRFDKLEHKTDARFDKLETKFESFKKDTAERFEKVDQKFDELKESLSSAKVWALGLYIALAGSLFYTLARGFKWL